jgi:hypothetical protein
LGQFAKKKKKKSNTHLNQVALYLFMQAKYEYLWFKFGKNVLLLTNINVVSTHHVTAAIQLS